MGGDHAPVETVAGAVLAAERGVDVVLVGDESQLHAHLEALGADLPIVHASQKIGMADNPVRAIRERPGSSIVRAAQLVRDGEADALVSAGSTGASLAAAAIIIGRLPGVLRPAIATIFPTPFKPTVVLDSGANPDCKAEHLNQFAVMGSQVARVYLGCENPRVGLLTIGEERGKGRDLERAAYDLLEWDPAVNFVGNVEGRDLANDIADVFVTDGFTGNVTLKTAEGMMRITLGMFSDIAASLSEAARSELLPHLKRLAEAMSADHGAHLVGSKGVVVIGHGSATAMGIANALAMAADGARRGLVSEIANQLASES